MKRFAVLLIIPMALGTGCGRSEISGTYAVELEIAGATRPLLGTLILSSHPLDIPASAEDPESIDSNLLGGDTLSANSCFILSPGGSAQTQNESNGEPSADPGVVRVFEARIQSDGVLTPIEILNVSDLRIEIMKLQFFSNAIGGELDVHTELGVRRGRIHGTRMGPVSAQQCAESLAAFRSMLRELQMDDGARPDRES